MTIIRCATIKDYEKIAEFSKLVALHHVKNRPDIMKKAPELTKREYKKTLKNKNWAVLIAEKNGMPVGYSKILIRQVGDKVWTETKLIHIYEIYVDPSFRRQGIASGLIEEIKKSQVKREQHKFCWMCGLSMNRQSAFMKNSDLLRKD